MRTVAACPICIGPGTAFRHPFIIEAITARRRMDARNPSGPFSIVRPTSPHHKKEFTTPFTEIEILFSSPTTCLHISSVLQKNPFFLSFQTKIIQCNEPISKIRNRQSVRNLDFPEIEIKISVNNGIDNSTSFISTALDSKEAHDDHSNYRQWLHDKFRHASYSNPRTFRQRRIE